MYLVDANVLIDIVAPNEWTVWSDRSLANAKLNGPAFLNPIIYAEVAAAFDEPDDLDQRLLELEVLRLDLPYRAAFVASKAFLRYRRSGGGKTSPLPDFFIGAHATVSGLTLITRDARRFRSYFPDVALISPD